MSVAVVSVHLPNLTAVVGDDGHIYVRTDTPGGGMSLRLSTDEAARLRDALTAILEPR